MTKLEKAKKASRHRKPVELEEIEAVVAFLRGEIDPAPLSRAIECPIAGLYSRCTVVVRDAVRHSLIKLEMSHGNK